MTSNCQSRNCSARCQARHDFRPDCQALQSLAASRDQEGVSRNEDFMDPAFLLPFNNMYPSQLEVQGVEDIQISNGTTPPGGVVNATNHGVITARSTHWITTKDRNINCKNEPSYTPITRPWEEQLYSPPRTNTAYGDQAQTPLAVWESQGPSEEPFSNIGEVPVKRAPLCQDKRSEGNSGGGKRMRRSSRRAGAV
jgi:hypothetical protein